MRSAANVLPYLKAALLLSVREERTVVLLRQFLSANRYPTDLFYRSRGDKGLSPRDIARFPRFWATATSDKQTSTIEA